MRIWSLLTLLLVITQVGQLKADEFIRRSELDELFTRAKVWLPTEVEAKDLFNGPERPDGFAFKELVKCNYLNITIGGFTQKFLCTHEETGKVIKVKYNQENREVYGEVLGSRLLWALGFGHDDNYPAIVHCKGCPRNVTKYGQLLAGSKDTYVFEPATIEVRNHRNQIEMAEDSGWKWDYDLFKSNPDKGGSTRAEIDALRLLGSFINHWDRKAANHRVVCLDETVDNLADCQVPFLMIHDHGSSFGGEGELFDMDRSAQKVDFEGWKAKAVWKNKSKCIAGLKSYHPIRESGRAHLAGLLSRLSIAQIRDLFTAARIELLGQKTGKGSLRRAVTVEDWVELFIEKSKEIINHHCPR